MTGDEDSSKDRLLGETIGHCVVDSGCTRTVCGDVWLNTYLDSLTSRDRMSVFTTNSTCHFRFGDGEVYTSSRAVHIPVYIGSEVAVLTTQVVSANIPLLLSRDSLKKADAHMNFQDDTINSFGVNIPMIISESGHCCLSLSRPLDSPNSPHTVMFTSPLKGATGEQCRSRVQKLHKQFAHAHPDRLKRLVRDSGIDDTDIMHMIDDVSAGCDICKRFKPTPPRPAVSFPLANTFNETVAMDLKQIGGRLILHMIDHATRYDAAVVIKNKKKETIVQAILEYWVRIFGAPQKFLSDNGGEFVNQELIDFAEKFNISIHTTAAESAWSNGMCEKHNDIIADMINKIMADCGCSFELAVPWSVAAKNSLLNVYGYSPNQLVFGRNPNTPAVHSDRPPAENSSADLSEYLSRNLAALHSARRAFIQQESCERLRRALSRKSRNIPFFSNGVSVYYKRNNSREWHGPAKVLGKDSQNYLLKHGGIYIRVHPCRLQPVCNEPVLDESVPNLCPQGSLPPDQSSPMLHSTDHAGQAGISDNDSEDDEPSGVPSHNLPLSPPNTPMPVPGEPDPGLAPVPPSPVLMPAIEDAIPDEPCPMSPTHQSPTSERINAQYEPDIPTVPLALRRLADYNKPPISDEYEEVLFTSNHTKFDNAKLDEITKWRDMDTFEEVDDTGQQPRVSCRWVYTEKEKGGKVTLKARLVARGFEEHNPQIRTDSPTCSKASLRLLLLVLSSSSWTLHSLDVKSAYLQGAPINRDLFLIPPKLAHTNKLWKLKKCPYGIADAGRHWYLRVLKELKSLGGRQAKLDPGLFMWHEDGNLIGIMAIHVDDFLFGGNDFFHAHVIEHLRNILTIGLEESCGMKYLGLHIKSCDDGIYMNTDAYTQSLEEVNTAGLGDKSRPLNPSEISALRHIAGQLNWLASQTRPDLAYDNCAVRVSVSDATVQDIFRANKVVRKAKGQKVSIRFPQGFRIQSCRIMGFCDASFANLVNRGSQGGFVVFLCDDDGQYCPIVWQSRRLRRVVSSTLAAECLAAMEVADTCVHMQAILTEIYPAHTQTNPPGTPFPVSILCDNKSLVDSVHTSTTVQSKRLHIDLCVLRDMILRGEIQEFRWVSTNYQVANTLTKAGSCPEYLLDILRCSMTFQESSGTFIRA